MGNQRLSNGQHQSSDGGTQQLQGLPSLVAHARMLMPEDSLGRELEAMACGNGDDGMSNNEQAWTFVSILLGHDFPCMWLMLSEPRSDCTPG